jgi:hypothetical protein
MLVPVVMRSAMKYLGNGLDASTAVELYSMYYLLYRN